MLTTRACFKLGHTSILYLLLALAINGKASDAKHEEFGCEFADEQYKMIESNKEHPVWSNATIESKPLQMFYQWYLAELSDKGYWTTSIDIEAPLKKLFSEKNIMNEVSLLSRFVTEYRKSTKNSNITLETFFNNYHVPFETTTYYETNETSIRNTTDPASYLIQELHALKEESLKGLNKSVSPYLVSAYVDPIEVKFNSPYTSISDDVEKLIHKRVQDHLAAVIKINVGNRTGYILIDPGYANGKNLFHPFVVKVMQDGKSPHGEFLTGKTNNLEIQFSVGGGKENSYIVAKHTGRGEMTTVRHVLYYVHKPYCSFMENTVKASLLRLNHGIISRDRNGEQMYSLTFKISEQFDGFNLKISSWYTDFSKYGRTFKEATQEDKEIIEKWFQIPREAVDIIVGQLDTIRSTVLDKKEFINEFSGLARKLGVERNSLFQKFVSLFSFKRRS